MNRFANSVFLLVICVLGLVCSRSVLSQANYTITDLGSLGGTSTVAYGINSKGQIVGSTHTNSDSYYHAFLWSNGVMTDLGNLSAFGGDSIANQINNNGTVVGLSGAISNGGTWHAFVWSNGTIIDVGTLPGYPISSGTGINNYGEVTANALMGFGNEQYYGHPFLWSNGTITDPGIPNATYAQVINDLGHVAGVFQPSSGTYHAYLWENETTIDLGTLPGYPYSGPRGINQYDQVVGYTTNDFYQAFSGHAFLWSNGQMTDLGTLGGAYSYGLGINNLGDAVGMANTASGAVDAFLYHNGVMYDLNSLIPSTSGAILTRADGINDAGQICASGTINGVWHAYQLTPKVRVLISNTIACPIGPTTATITWTTNLPANTTVAYGTTTALGNSVSDPTLVTSHSLTLSGLTPLTHYYYRVQSTDPTGKTQISALHSFSTGPTNAAALYYLLGGIQRQSDGSYTVEVRFGNKGGQSIPDVKVTQAALGAATSPTSPSLPQDFVLPSASASTLTFTFPSSAGASGTKVTMSVAGETLDAFGNITGFFKVNFKNVLLP